MLFGRTNLIYFSFIVDPMCTSNLTILASCLVTKNCTMETNFQAFVRCAGTRCLSAFMTDVFMSGGQNCLSCVILNLPDLAKVAARSVMS